MSARSCHQSPSLLCNNTPLGNTANVITLSVCSNHVHSSEIAGITSWVANNIVSIQPSRIQFESFFSQINSVINFFDMVAMKTPSCSAIYREFRHGMTSIVDVGEDHDSAVDRLRQVLDARDSATWNFDFRTSTPLPGRYDWRRSSGHTVEAGRSGDRDPFITRRGRCPKTPKRSSARRCLVFDERDLAAADRAVTTFLLKRLASPQRYPDIPEQSSPESREVQHIDLCSTSSMLPAVVASGDDQRHQRTASSDAANFHVRPSSSTERRKSPTTTKRTRVTTCENPPLRVTKITGKHAVKILS